MNQQNTPNKNLIENLRALSDSEDIPQEYIDLFSEKLEDEEKIIHDSQCKVLRIGENDMYMPASFHHVKVELSEIILTSKVI